MAKEKWSQFFVFSSIEKHRINGLCKLCHKNYKDRQGVYSNFVKHLKRIHGDEFKRLISTDGEYLNEEGSDAKEDQTMIDLVDVKQKQNQFVLSMTKNLVIKCELPLSFIEHPSFRDFLKECKLKFEPVSSRKLKHVIIPSLKDNVLKTIHEALNNANNLTLTIDGWSDRRCRSYLGVTCHFIDENMIPQAYLIDFLRFKSPHSGERILSLTEDCLNRFDIKEKVFKIITDNASSMIKAYKFGLFTDDDDDDDDDDVSECQTSSMSDDYDGK